MSDFNPVSLFHIVWQVLSGWFWPLVIVALVLIYGVYNGFKGLRHRGLRAGPPLFWGLLAGLLVTVVATWFLPYSTHADLSMFRSFIDFLAVVLLALVVGLGVFALVFSIAARKRIRRIH
jgi:pilus assembly protein TadC